MSDDDPIYRACLDKPHRCPVCWKIPGQLGLVRFKWYKTYQCNSCRAVFTRLPLPGRQSACGHLGIRKTPCGSVLDVLHHHLVWRPRQRLAERRYRQASRRGWRR